MPHELGFPEHDSSAPPPVFDANTESFLDNLPDPHFGHLVPSQLLERTRISLSFSHFSQWNS